jgi:hypothetical protein
VDVPDEWCSKAIIPPWFTYSTILFPIVPDSPVKF